MEVRGRKIINMIKKKVTIIRLYKLIKKSRNDCMNMWMKSCDDTDE